MAERGSDKGGPRLDDELARETRDMEQGAPTPARAEESRQQEAAAQGEPSPDTRPLAGDVERRTELARHLRPSAFPADRRTLLETARAEGATEDVLSALRTLPEGRTFSTVEEVWTALGPDESGP